MATLKENTDWALQFNTKVCLTFDASQLSTLFWDSEKLFRQLVLWLSYADKFCNERKSPSALDIAKAQRFLLLQAIKNLTRFEALLLIDYFVFCLEARSRMFECEEFRSMCLSRLPPRSNLPHQFTQRVLQFAAIMAEGSLIEEDVE